MSFAVVHLEPDSRPTSELSNLPQIGVGLENLLMEEAGTGEKEVVTTKETRVNQLLFVVTAGLSAKAKQELVACQLQ